MRRTRERPAGLSAWMATAVLLVLAAGGCADEGSPPPEVTAPPATEDPAPPTTEDPAPPTPAAPRPKEVFHSPLAGRWYEANAEVLRAQLQGFLEEAEGEARTDVRALVLPHAGYRWSGRAAARGVRWVAGRQFRRVVVMGPSHRYPLENAVSVPDVTHYATPLGEVALDLEFIAALEPHPEFTSVPVVHQNEHSVQIQVPLLQQALPSLRLVPLVVGDLDRETSRRVAGILRSLIDDETLVVASTDFTHYGPRFGYVPFDEDVPDRLRALDMGAFAEIERIDADAFVRYVEERKATICGRRPVEVLLRMLPPDAKVVAKHYDTSGRMNGGYTNSVSYLSVVFQTTWPPQEEPAVETTTEPLSRSERAALAELARGALTCALEGRAAPTPEEMGIDLTPALRQVRGAFVTLRREGKLRGCIGEIQPARPLYRAVMGTAVSAALRDRRFAPVTAAELPALELKVSALTTPRPIGSWKEIVLGRHGIVLRKEGQSATFLPQVAPEQGWDLETTLTRLATKAGLAPDAWRQGATFLVFEAEVFGEDEE